MLKATNTAQDVRSGFHHQMMMWYITTDAEKRSVQHPWFPITVRDQRRGGRWVLKCKLGGDNYRNQEGYTEINSLMICSDWDIDCQQCRVVELEAKLEEAESDLKLLTDNMKVYRTTEELFADLDEVPNLKARLAKAQSNILDASFVLANKDGCSWASTMTSLEDAVMLYCKAIGLNFKKKGVFMDKGELLDELNRLKKALGGE